MLTKIAVSTIRTLCTKCHHSRVQDEVHVSIYWYHLVRKIGYLWSFNQSTISYHCPRGQALNPTDPTATSVQYECNWNKTWSPSPQTSPPTCAWTSCTWGAIQFTFWNLTLSWKLWLKTFQTIQQKQGNGSLHRDELKCLYRDRLKGLYVVARSLLLLLLTCSAWPCLGPA